MCTHLQTTLDLEGWEETKENQQILAEHVKFHIGSSSELCRINTMETQGDTQGNNLQPSDAPSSTHVDQQLLWSDAISYSPSPHLK